MAGRYLLLDEATLNCPDCGVATIPFESAHGIVAWYACGACGHHWSARLRGGRPDLGIPVDLGPLQEATTEHPASGQLLALSKRAAG